MKRNSLFRTLLILSLYFIFSSNLCIESEDIKCDSNGCFNLVVFEQNIIDAIDGNVVGYSYAINSEGDYYSSGQGGYARTPADGGINMGSDLSVNIASLSKTITTIAVMKKFDDVNLNIDYGLILFLPPHWVTGPNIDKITIRDLLTQTSGIRARDGSGENNLPLDYNGLKETIRLGIDSLKYGVGNYQNTNFALFRIILPYMNGHTYAGSESADAIQTSDKYVDYVKTNVFNKVSASDATTALPNNSIPWFYPFPDNGVSGYADSDWTLESGGGGWHCSVVEYARVLKRLKYTEQLLPAGLGQQMMNDGLGMKFADFGIYGTGNHHNGVLFFKKSGTPEGGMFASYYIFPNDVEAVVFYNSRPGPKHIDLILRDAWLDAWV